VHASNAARLEQSYRDIASYIKISGRRNPKANIFELVQDWLRNERKGKWILILDNVDDANFLLEAQTTAQDGQQSNLKGRNLQPLVSYLPQCQNGSILITTRSRNVALKLVEQRNTIVVEPMNKADVVTLTAKKLDLKGDSYINGDINDLVVALECMPLAIIQATAYISHRAPHYSVQQYLQDFQKSDRKKSSLLNYTEGQLRRDWEATNSIIITWQISFNYIRQTRPTAADLLSLMSFFDRQGIPEALVQNRTGHRSVRQDRKGQYRDYDNSNDGETSSQSSQSDEFEDDVMALRNFSFISINADRTTFEMHRLVQLATRKWLEAHGQLERWKQQFVRNLYVEFPTGEYENWPKCQELFHTLNRRRRRGHAKYKSH
jgi:hypothetical protein